MEIRAAALTPPLPDRIAATGPPSPEGDFPPPAATADAIALAIIDGILVRGDGGRERITLRLLPPALEADFDAELLGESAASHALAARVVGNAAASAGAASPGGPAGGALRLETSLGTIEPNPPFAATPGSTLRVDIVARAALPGPAGAAMPAAVAQSAVPASDIGAALAALPEAVRSGDDLAASLLLLLAALPAGSERLAQAFGDDRPVPSAAGSEGMLIAAEGELGWWRASLVPWPLAQSAGGAHLLRRARPKRHDDKEDAEEAPVRVVLELALDRWGRLQLDGLYRRRRFDLMLRSHVPLAAGIREEAERRFRARLVAGGLAGGLAFAVTKDFPVSAAPSSPALSLEV
jgi:hypothetical protein